MLYLDTSLLVSLYVPEEASAETVRLVTKESTPLPICPCHRLEFQNAVALKAFRKEITPDEADRVADRFLADLAAGVFNPVSISQEEWWSEATALSRRHTLSLGARSLDILHVAAARLLRASTFATSDPRQRSLAKAAGLNVK